MSMDISMISLAAGGWFDTSGVPLFLQRKNTVFIQYAPIDCARLCVLVI